MKNVKLISKIEVAEDVYLLSFPKVYDYQAGQVIGMSTSEIIPPRLYSLCSSPKDAIMQVIFNVRKQGELTPELAKLKAGQTLYLDEPHGSFLGNKEPAWWIATGTGIAPYYAMIKDGFGPNKRLIHGERSADRFYFSKELTKALGPHYIRCASQSKTDGDFDGRVTDYLNSLKTLPTNVKYYLCGNPDMVIETRDLLISRGIRFQNILSEIYF